MSCPRSVSEKKLPRPPSEAEYEGLSRVSQEGLLKAFPRPPHLTFGGSRRALSSGVPVPRRLGGVRCGPDAASPKQLQEIMRQADQPPLRLRVDPASERKPPNPSGLLDLPKDGLHDAFPERIHRPSDSGLELVSHQLGHGSFQSWGRRDFGVGGFPRVPLSRRRFNRGDLAVFQPIRSNLEVDPGQPLIGHPGFGIIASISRCLLRLSSYVQFHLDQLLHQLLLIVRFIH